MNWNCVMEIVYKDRKLGGLVKDVRNLSRVLGQKRATILLRRIDDMSAATGKQDLLALPGRYHELTGNRRGEWACDLDQPYRLIFKVERQVITITEIVNYHGK